MHRPPREWAAGAAVWGLLGCGPVAAPIMASRAALGRPPEDGVGLGGVAFGGCATLVLRRVGGRCRHARTRTRHAWPRPSRGAASAVLVASHSWRCTRLVRRHRLDAATRRRQMPLRGQRGRHVQRALAVGADPDLDVRLPRHEGLRRLQRFAVGLRLARGLTRPGQHPVVANALQPVGWADGSLTGMAGRAVAAGALRADRLRGRRADGGGCLRCHGFSAGSPLPAGGARHPPPPDRR